MPAQPRSSPHRSSSPTPPWLSLSARRLLTLPCFCCPPKFLRNRGVDGARAAWLQGGGPYGKQVTRGQDLTGKDFSGLTLVKQDFKTVYCDCMHISPCLGQFSYNCYPMLLDVKKPRNALNLPSSV